MKQAGKIMILFLSLILICALYVLPAGAIDTLSFDFDLDFTPESPSNLEGEAISATSIQLTWDDNSNLEEAFYIYRVKWIEGKVNILGKVAEVAADTTEYTDKGLSPGSTYKYKVKAVNSVAESEFSDIITVSTPNLIDPGIIDPPIVIDPDLFKPVAPSDLDADDISSDEVELSWDDNSGNETGFKLERAKGTSGSFSLLETLDEDEEEYTDDSVAADTTYKYRIRAYNGFGNSAYSDVLTVKTEAEDDDVDDVDDEDDNDDYDDDDAYQETVNLRFVIGSKSYKWNGTSQAMDVGPVIRESRTLLPIRYVADPLGAKVLWNANEGKVTVQTDSKTIELWINNNTAKVDGKSVKIDSNNNNVTPVIIPPGRTMLPLRFIADNLDCDVVWNPADKSIIVTYPD